jgi:hypothetical protein
MTIFSTSSNAIRMLKFSLTGCMGSLARTQKFRLSAKSPAQRRYLPTFKILSRPQRIRQTSTKWPLLARLVCDDTSIYFFTSRRLLQIWQCDEPDSSRRPIRWSETSFLRNGKNKHVVDLFSGVEEEGYHTMHTSSSSYCEFTRANADAL